MTDLQQSAKPLPQGLLAGGWFKRERGLVVPRQHEIIRCPAILHSWEEIEEAPLEAISVTDLGESHTTSIGATLTLGSVNVPAGALIVACVFDGGGTPSGTGSTCADGTNGSYTGVLPTYVGNSSSNEYYIKLFYFANSAALSSATITYTPTSTGNYVTLSALYATGILKVSPYDSGVAAALGSSGGISSLTSGAPAVSGELFIGFAGSLGTASQGSAPWATPPDGNVSFSAIGANQINSGSGALTYDPALNNAWAILIAGFKPIVVPGAPPRRIVYRRKH